MKNVPDSVLLPEYMATELILTQKDDIRAASRQKWEGQASWKGDKAGDGSAEGLAGQ